MGAGAGELPGPAPAIFFAPTRIAKRSEDWGRAAVEARVVDAWRPFCDWIDGWLETIDRSLDIPEKTISTFEETYKQAPRTRRAARAD